MMMVKAILAIISHRDGWHLLGTLVPLQGSWLPNKISFVLNDKSKFICCHFYQSSVKMRSIQSLMSTPTTYHFTLFHPHMMGLM